jgi:cobalt-zinc-cadmium efflux system outer membrane protein
VKRILFFILLLSAYVRLPMFSQDGLTLEQAISMALKQNPDIAAVEKELARSQGKRLQMEAIPDPEIVLSDEGIAYSKTGKAASGEKEISFGIQQNLEFPGKRTLRGKIGKYGEDLASLDLEQTRMIVRARVKRAYYKAKLTQRTIAALEKTSSLLDQLIETITIRYQAGAAAYSDVLRAKVEKARLQNQVLEERKSWKESTAELNLLLGRNGDEPLTLLTDIAYVPFDKSLPQFKDEALSSRPALKIMDLRLNQAEASLKLANMNRLPDFSLGFFSPSLRGGAWGFALSFSVPLYWWKKQKGEILEAEADRDINRIESGARQKRILARIDAAYVSVKAAEEQVKVFEQRLLGEMEDELKISIEYYQYGKMEPFSLLDLYRTYTTTKVEHLKALYLYLVSLADLEIAGEESE